MTKTRRTWKRAGSAEVAGGVDDGDGERGSRARRETERSRYWRGVIADWEASGMTQAGFCRSRGLSTASFYYWKSRFKQEKPAETETGIVPVSNRLCPRTENHRVTSERQVNSPFIPVDVVGSVSESMDGDRIMVWLPNGCRLDVPQGFDPESGSGGAPCGDRVVGVGDGVGGAEHEAAGDRSKKTGCSLGVTTAVDVRRLCIV